MGYTILLSIVLSVSCPKTELINKSKLPWNKWDHNRMQYCQRHCSKEYGDAPCLKKFIKLGFQSYFCECGKP